MSFTLNIYKNIEKQVSDNLNKEIAQGFSYVSCFIKDWTKHPDFRVSNNYSDNYYEESYEIIQDLSW